MSWTNVVGYFADRVKHWYIFLFIGILFIGTGIWTFMNPQESYLALGMVFSIAFIVGWVLGMFFAIMSVDTVSSWIWSTIFSAIAVIIGLMMLFNPPLADLTLGIFVGFVILLQSAVLFAMSIEMKQEDVSDWFIIMILGFLTALFASMVILNPQFAGLTVVFWTGIAFIALGAVYIYISFKLKDIKKWVKWVQNQIQDGVDDMKDNLKDGINSMKNKIKGSDGDDTDKS